MNWIDVVIIIIIAGSLIYSLIKGFIKETFFLGGIVAGLLAALKGYSFLGQVLGRWWDKGDLVNIVSFLIILVAVFIAIRILGWFVEKGIKSTGLSALNRAMGAVLGAAKGTVIASVMLLLIIGFTESGERHAANSRLSPLLLKFTSLLSVMLPEKTRDGFKKTYGNLKNPERLRGLSESLKGRSDG